LPTKKPLLPCVGPVRRASKSRFASMTSLQWSSRPWARLLHDTEFDNPRLPHPLADCR
jgi:hypothetical protein